jgi:RNA polymerase sigma factor (sigma-70 family)
VKAEGEQTFTSLDSTLLDQLFTRVALGDRAAVEDAFQALHPIVRRYCRKRLGDTSDAEDATQTTLIKMFEQAADYDSKRSSVSWALAIAYFECQTTRKSRLRDALRHPLVDTSLQPTNLPDPEAILSEQQLTDIASELVRDLSPEDQSLVGAGTSDLTESLSQVSLPAHRKRKQRLLSRLSRAFSAIVAPHVPTTKEERP